MAKIAQPITVMAPGDALAGQILIKTNDPGLVADGKNIIQGPSGDFYYNAGGKTVQDILDEIRALPKLNPNLVYHTNDNGGPGFWVLDSTDTASVDNSGTILVTGAGERVKRRFNGNIHAGWFGVSPSNSDNSAALQAALNAAAVNDCDVELRTAGTFKIASTVTIPGRHLILGSQTVIQATGSMLMFNMQPKGLIDGGIIDLGTSTGVTGVFLWGGYDWSLEGGLTLHKTLIRGNRIGGQRGIYCAVGVDDTMTPIASSDGQFVSWVEFRCTIYGVEDGLVLANEASTGNGWMNALQFHGFITAAKGITSWGNQHRFSGVIQSEQTTYVTPNATLHYAAKLNGDNLNFNMGIYDFVGQADNEFMIIGTQTNSTIITVNNNVNANIIRHKGFRNESPVFDQKSKLPFTSNLERYTGDLDNLLFYADKKFTVTTDSVPIPLGSLSRTFRPLVVGTGGIESNCCIEDAPTGSEKTITIDLLKSYPFVYSFGINFQINSGPDYLKLEYYDGSAWVTAREDTDETDITEAVVILNEVTASKFRVTLSKANNSVSNLIIIARIFAYGAFLPEAHLPCGGGNIYGDLNLLASKSAPVLSTDANGKVTKGWSDDVTLSGDGSTQQFVVPYAFGTAPSRIILQPQGEVAALANFYVVSQNAAGFTIKSAGAIPPDGSGNIKFSFIAIP